MNEPKLGDLIEVPNEYYGDYCLVLFVKHIDDDEDESLRGWFKGLVLFDCDSHNAPYKIGTLLNFHFEQESCKIIS